MRRPGIYFANLSSGFFSYRPSSSMDQWLEPPEGPPLDQAPMVGDLFTTKQQKPLVLLSGRCRIISQGARFRFYLGEKICENGLEFCSIKRTIFTYIDLPHML